MPQIVSRSAFLFGLLTILVSAPAFSQQALIRGFVSDGSTEQTMQGASVTLFSNNVVIKGVVSDADGYFLINRIAPGTYTFQVSFIGFKSFEEELEIQPGSVIERTVLLSPIQLEIGEVIVEAEAEGGATAVIAGLETVVPADIARVPVPGVSGDLAGYLQTLPGVVIQGDRGGQIFVRGGAVDQNLALLDGLPVYMPFHILSFYSAFPEDIVNRVDFYTGGFGAEYGSRVSSIIDVKARNGNKQNIAGAVGFAPFLSEARFEGPIIRNRASLIVNLRQSFIEELFPNLLGQRMPYRFGDRFAKLHTLIGSSHSLSLMILDTDDRGDIAGTKKTFDGETLSSIKTDSTEVSWTNQVYGGTYEFQSNRIPLVVRLTAGWSFMNNEFGPKDAPERITDVESFDLKLYASWLLKAGTIDFGFSRRKSTLSYELDGLFQDFTTASEDLTEVEAFVSTNLSVAKEKLTINPGVHMYALTDRSRSWLEPRFRMSWYPLGRTGSLTLHGAWGVYHQATVGLNDERDLGNQFTAWVVTPDDGDIPQSIHTIAGVSYRFAPWLNVAVEGFYKKYDELSVPIFSSFPSFTTALQSADGVAKGVDIRIDMQNRPFIENTTLSGYLTYGFAEVEYDSGGLIYHPGHDRRHQLNALVTADLREVSLTVQFQYGSGLPFTESGGFDKWYLLTPDVDVASEPGQDRILYSSPFEGRQPTYSRMDVWLEKRIEHGRNVTTLRAGVVNLLNRDNLFYYDLFEFRRVDQLPLIPSIGVKFELR